MTVYVPTLEVSFETALRLLKSHDFTLVFERTPTPREALETVAVFVTVQTLVNEDFLLQFPRLEAVIAASNGIDHIDTSACRRAGVRVYSAGAANANAVAELVIGQLVLITRHVIPHHRLLTRGKWRDHSLLGTEFSSLTLGLVGCGAIGRLVAQKALALGVKKVFAYDPYVTSQAMRGIGVTKSDLYPLLEAADVVSLHLPSLPDTRHFIGAKELTRMKESAFLINTSRGDIIDERALLTALNARSIQGAALDVFQNEPRPLRELVDSPFVFATPHLGAFTKTAREAMALQPTKEWLLARNHKTPVFNIHHSTRG